MHSRKLTVARPNGICISQEAHGGGGNGSFPAPLVTRGQESGTRPSNTTDFVFVPEGRMIIAQRFNVGFSRTKANKSRRDGRHWPPRSAVPSGRVTVRAHQPNVETLGYCQMSLRDKGLAQCSPLSSASNHSGIGRGRLRPWPCGFVNWSSRFEV